MWHFDGENKPGFAKLTRSVYLVYTGSIVAKVYGIDIELFSWFYRVKKTDVFLIAKFAAYQRCHGSPLRCGGRVRPGLSWDFYAG